MQTISVFFSLNNTEFFNDVIGNAGDVFGGLFLINGSYPFRWR